LDVAQALIRQTLVAVQGEEAPELDELIPNWKEPYEKRKT
jgi:hypothetical protein